MFEPIIVEAVSDKYKNKFSSGSVLAGGKWLQVSSKVPLNLFQKDTQINVELKTNDKGYTSIVAIETDAPTNIPQDIEVKKETQKVKDSSYEENKNRRILVQGIVQAVAQSPALAGLPYSTLQEAASNIKTLASDLIQFVDSQV